MLHWPYFYYPTTCVFVDDQTVFLNAIKNRLFPHLAMNFYNNPLEALDTIQNNNDMNPCHLMQSLFSLDDSVEIDADFLPQSHISLHWDELSKIIYNSNRFATKSVLIIDQMMPELDGITFCRKLKDNPIKKIMLTANADHSLAVQAFNEGLIDFFILKDTPNLSTQLLEAIKMQQKAYFKSLTKSLLGGLAKTVSLINDASTITFYENMRNDLQATEYYLLDRWGSTLFLNQAGKLTTLVVCPANMLDAFSQIALDQDDPQIAEDLLTKQKLIYFPAQSDYLHPVNEWEYFMHPAKRIEGHEELFYALINDPKQQPIQLTNIQSYGTYLSRIK